MNAELMEIRGKLDEDLWLDWLFKAEMAKCQHEHMVDESYGGPDSGCVDMYCPRCGWGHHEWLY